MTARLEIKINKLRILYLIFLTCLMVGLSYLCTTASDDEVRIAGWIGVFFFSIGFLVFPRQLLSEDSQVVIDEHGIEDRRSKFGLVEWSDIVSIGIGEIDKQKFLCLKVIDPSKYLDRVSGVGKFAAKANRALGFSEITVSFTGLSYSAEMAMKFCTDNYLHK